MQSIGLALTISLLTGTLVALDLSATQGPAPQPILFAPGRGANGLAIMPSSTLGLAVPKADLRNGVFAIGSSAGNEGRYESTEDASEDENDSDRSLVSPELSADSDYVLI